MKLPANSIKKVGVFRALQLGDMLCATPAMRALRHAYPDAEIILIGLPWAASFVQRFSKYFDRFIHFPGCKGLPEQSYDPSTVNRFINQMKKESFDLLLQMQGNGTVVNPLLSTFGAKYFAGFHNSESRQESELFLEYPNFGPEIKRHLLLIEYLGIEPQGTFLEFPLLEKDEKEVKKLYAPLFDKKYVIVHPGSRSVNRQWPPQYFAGLADYCIEHGFTVAITGTADEKDVTNELIKCMHHPPINLTGKTSLGAVGVLIKNAFMLVANCTGASHIASALKTPSVIISMDGEPNRWAPLDTSIHKAIDCSEHVNFEQVHTQMVSLMRLCGEPAFSK